MKKNKIDVEHLVMSTILEMYPTERVEQNLETNSRLRDDLFLSWDEILRLGIEIDAERLPERIFTIEQVKAWVTVNDIIQGIKAIPGIEHFEEWPITD